MIILDSSVVIAHLNPDDFHHRSATQLLVDVVDEVLGVSPLTLAEVLVGPARIGQLNAAEAAIRDLGIETVGLSPSAPVRLATLRATTGLRLPDCCVLLAAETQGATVATFDHRLSDSAKMLGLAVQQQN